LRAIRRFGHGGTSVNFVSRHPDEVDFMVVTNAQVHFMVKSNCRSHLRAMTDRLRQIIASRVKASRMARGWSQEELAARISKTPESISNIERAKQLPALDTLLDLARVLDLPTVEVIEASKDARNVSRERADNEARLVTVVQGLSDTAVSIALQQIEALKSLK
jgi:ribosome-binding protein aMBF1 (putative translation factor)